MTECRMNVPSDCAQFNEIIDNHIALKLNDHFKSQRIFFYNQLLTYSEHLLDLVYNNHAVLTMRQI